jgi:hypothetical protein
MSALIKQNTKITDEVLNAIAHLPTKSLPAVVEREFFAKLSDRNFMRVAVHLAQKSFDEGGCPIAGVIIDNEIRQIVGKGHNTLVQDNDPYNHGETSAIRDAGRQDFSRMTIFTTLSPCDVCAASYAPLRSCCGWRRNQCVWKRGSVTRQRLEGGYPRRPGRSRALRKIPAAKARA